MAEITDLEEPMAPAARRYWRRWIFGGSGMILAALLVVAYGQRLRIAENFAEDTIGKYGVRANYRIKDIGFRTQRLENVVLGDPANPDFVAKLVEIDVSINFGGVTIRDIRANGVKVRGRYEGGKLSFGELDKFADPNNKDPIEIPDIGLKLTNGQIGLDTPWGPVGAGLSGEGLLRQRFEGDLALRAPRLQYHDCAVDAVRFDGRFLFDFRQPVLIGPWTADAVKCASARFTAAKPKIAGDLRLSERFNSWFGDVTYSAAALQSGDVKVSRAAGSLGFDGKKERTNFTAKLDQAVYASADFNAANVKITSKGYADFTGSPVKIAVSGNADIAGGALARHYISAIPGITKSAAKTPVAPLLDRMVPAIQRAIADFGGNFRYDFSMDGGQALVAIDGAYLQTRSGVKARQSGLLQVKQSASGWSLGSPLNLSMSGGDLPALRLALQQGPRGRGNYSGLLQAEQYAAGSANLSLPKLAFAGSIGGAWRFDGNALLSGPLPGGFVTALKLPIDGRYDGRNFAFYSSCQTIGFDALKYNALSLGRQSLRLCPDQGSILQTGAAPLFNGNAPAFAIDGRYAGSRFTARGRNIRFNLNRGFVADNVAATWGDAPIRVTAPIVRFDFTNGFASQNIHVETGTLDALTVFDIPALNGRLTGDGARGNLSGAAGQIANVPLLMTEAQGDWRLIDGDLTLEGSLRVDDAAQIDRFKTMRVPDVLLTFEDGVVNMLGNLQEPTTGRKVAGLDIRHMVADGAGRALLAVDDLTFDSQLQPELLTPLTLGVIQNVNGSVHGDGTIIWDTKRDGVTSTGNFGTKNLDFAAAFGPVRGLQTDIKFSDLLALETSEIQEARIGSVNPGVAALDGIVKYRLLADQKVQIEGGSWPFAGGELTIRPTIWDFGVETKRELILEVKGLEIAKFLATLDLGNLSATGVFDGTLPMVFDADGGQIIGGELIARPGGGNVSYIGELTYKDLSPYANFAFDALRSIDYTGLRIGMRGNLAGEIITDINFEGIKQGAAAKRNFITRQLADIPIKFNIRIEAPFFELFGSVRSFYDPQYLVERNRIEILRRIKENGAKNDAAIKASGTVSLAPALSADKPQ